MTPTILPSDDTFLATLFQEQYEPLLRYTRSVMRKYGASYISDSERAEDVVQEVFYLALERKGELRAKESPVGWLFRTAVHKVQETLRDDRAWIKRLSLISTSGGSQFIGLGHMPEDWKPHMTQKEFDLLWKFYLEGYKYTELCEEYGMKKSALAMKIKRIKERFQNNYDNF